MSDLVERLRVARENIRLNCDGLDTGFVTGDDMGALDDAITAIASIEQGMGALREAQSKAVMPLIGALLDAWESIPNDTLSLDELTHVAEAIAQIDNAMESITEEPESRFMRAILAEMEQESLDKKSGKVAGMLGPRAHACECGSASFHLLESGNVECAGCQKREFEWGDK